MSYYQLKDGRWVVQYRSRRDPGKMVREYFGRGVHGLTKAKARHEALFGKNRRRAPAPVGIRFDELAAEYLKAAAGRLKKSSMDCLVYKLAGVILPELGHVDVYSLTPKIMDLYVQKRLKSVKRTTVHRELSDIMAILNWGVARGMMRANPLAGYKKPSRDDAVIAPPSVAEIRALVREAPEHLRRALVIAYYTGLRPGQAELFGLKWTDINWTDRTIIIRSAQKGGVKSRIVPMHPDLEKRLKTWQTESGHTSPYIITYKGRPVASIKKAFATAKKKAGINRRMTFYSMRHAFATYLLGQSADLKMTSMIMGHSSPTTTMRIYQHASMDLARQTIDKLPAIDYDEQQKKP